VLHLKGLAIYVSPLDATLATLTGWFISVAFKGVTGADGDGKILKE
jgi:hypothetical protein